MTLACDDVQAAIRRGDENQDVLEHLANCATCRARAESTLLVGGGATEKRRPAALPSRLPWLIALVLIPMVGVLIVIVRLRTRVVEGPSTSHPAHSAQVTPLKVTPVAAPPLPSAALRELSVDSDPPATVFIDGDPKSVTPYRGTVAPGRVLIELRADGYKSVRKVVLVGDENPAPLVIALDKLAKAGAHESDARTDEAQPKVASTAVASSRPVAVAAHEAVEKPAPAEQAQDELKPVPDRPAAIEKPAASARPSADDAPPVVTGTGYLTITTDPWAKVILDGKDIGRTTPLNRFTTTAGHHTIELRARTGTITVEADVKPKQELEIDKTIE